VFEWEHCGLAFFQLFLTRLGSLEEGHCGGRFGRVTFGQWFGWYAEVLHLLSVLPASFLRRVVAPLCSDWWNVISWLRDRLVIVSDYGLSNSEVGGLDELCLIDVGVMLDVSLTAARVRLDGMSLT